MKVATAAHHCDDCSMDDYDDCSMDVNTAYPVLDDAIEKRHALIDSRASKCLFNSRSFFKYLKKKDTGLHTASSEVKVKEAGPVEPIKEAYLLSEASHNLISIGELDNLGCRVIFMGGRCIIEKDGKIIVSVEKKNNAWSVPVVYLFDEILATLSTEELNEMWWLPNGSKESVMSAVV